MVSSFLYLTICQPGASKNNNICLIIYIKRTKNIIICTVSHIGFCNTISVVEMSDQVRVLFRSLIISLLCCSCMFTPDVAITGAQIKPGKRKTHVAKTLILDLSSGNPLTVDMISISILV